MDARRDLASCIKNSALNRSANLRQNALICDSTKLNCDGRFDFVVAKNY